VAIEALCAGKNVLAYNQTRRSDIIPFIREGITLNAKNRKEIKVHLRSWIAGRLPSEVAVWKKVDRVCYKPDGNAAKRIADLAFNLAKKRSKTKKSSHQK
jgi:hypothetical protein